ncbi:tRNA pseudouridine(55) synthase TruB [Gordoniibacillus kamchatkensis]|uniref:tRNA pseudouridine(55) synthase TruB n=1 Tax=Gordoniibacillus kamchatkensis TaxID=1590651 RepID=UPI0006977455|nr:tRNA pseudouridine(55) synthase TruB [Paenibacillus sp. VKM B-2647]
MTLEGVLPVWKPAGMTSHDVVARVRRITREKRIGHTGTLDPQVTGVLPLCIGHATRVVEFVQELPKTYVAKLVFGIATDTEDMTGTVIERAPAVHFERGELESVLDRFRGEIWQLPPMYSAVKVDGKRLYELARSGETAERKPRPVTIYRLELLDWKPDAELPEAAIEAECSKGTYIRTLCVDIGRALGVPAAMSELVRTRTGHWTKDNCYTLEEIEQLQQRGELASRLVPIDEAVSHLPAVELSDAAAAHALQGRKLPLEKRTPAITDGAVVRAYAPQRQFIGLFTWDEGPNALVPLKIFLHSYQKRAAADLHR